MEDFSPFALLWVGLALVCLVAYVDHTRRQRRRQGMAAAAASMGLEYSHRDPFGLVDLPFDIFGRGDGRGVENVVSGTYRGTDVKLFDYWYYEESSDSKGHRSRHYRRFTCALAEIDVDAPHLKISAENLGRRIADALGFGDIDFESEEFNRAFDVRCDDRRFAYALIDAQMISWLLGTGGRYAFEIIGPFVLMISPTTPPEELPELVSWLQGFRSHVPRVVASLYPTAGPP